MMKTMAKRLAARLTLAGQQELKRYHFRREIVRGTFRTDEPEWESAERWLGAGDWAIDVGANIGHYTKRFSDLVGRSGRVVAFEPVLATFELLAANVARFQVPNVTLLNLAASDTTQLVAMEIPKFDTGLNNYYQAAISDANADLHVLSCSIDSLRLPHPVRLIKIDAEGHDAVVLRGAKELLERDRPVVVIESTSDEVEALMASLGYVGDRAPGSSNAVYSVQKSESKGGV